MEWHCKGRFLDGWLHVAGCYCLILVVSLVISAPSVGAAICPVPHMPGHHALIAWGLETRCLGIHWEFSLKLRSDSRAGLEKEVQGLLI